MPAIPNIKYSDSSIRDQNEICVVGVCGGGFILGAGEYYLQDATAGSVWNHDHRVIGVQCTTTMYYGVLILVNASQAFGVRARLQTLEAEACACASKNLAKGSQKQLCIRASAFRV